jgi:hypothetical protein
MTADEDAKDEKVVFFTSGIQLAQIDDYRFSSRISSRAEAVRKLIDIAIGTLGEKKKSSRLPEAEVLKAAEKRKNYTPRNTPTRRSRKKE